MARAIIIVLDSFGVGYSEDAKNFGDIGANTFINLAQYYLEKENKVIQLPHLGGLGLHALSKQASNAATWENFANSLQASNYHIDDFYYPPLKGGYGYMAEISTGKDTPSGHWEMAGVPVLFDWSYFTDKQNSFSAELIAAINEKTAYPGMLGNCHASGTDIISALGSEHVKTGLPICYTSADSVFQVAAHEEHFGLDNLHRYCQQVRELLDDSELTIGRVIARPFVGEAGQFVRTGNRRDYSVLPPSATVLEKITHAGGQVISVGKIADIFAQQGISIKTKATGLQALVDATITHMKTAEDNSVIFTNLVNFDQDFGHRRDPIGYAKELEAFDQRLPNIIAAMQADDLLLLTADHGCDPTWHGSEHTREYVPLLTYHQTIDALWLGQRASFADLGQTLAALFNVDAMDYGTSFLPILYPAKP